MGISSGNVLVLIVSLSVVCFIFWVVYVSVRHVIYSYMYPSSGLFTGQDDEIANGAAWGSDHRHHR